jgi:hypothetical protein
MDSLTFFSKLVATRLSLGNQRRLGFKSRTTFATNLTILDSMTRPFPAGKPAGGSMPRSDSQAGSIIRPFFR